MSPKYPDPYPIEETGPLGRIPAWWYFRSRTNISVVDGAGEEKTVKLSGEDGLIQRVKGGIRFILYNPAPSGGPQDSPPPGGSEGPEWGESPQNNTVPIEDDEYTPQDMEQKEGEPAIGFWEIDPPLSGYYYGGIRSHYNSSTMKWSKQKRLSKYTQSPDLDTKKPSHVFSGRPTSLHSLPLPRGSQIDMSTLEPRNAKIFLDQNGCFYITTKSPIDLSFHFYTGQKYTTLEPIPEDGDRIDHGGFTEETREEIERIQKLGKSGISLALCLCDYIKTSKKYHIGYQAHIHRTSTTNNYIYNLDASEVLECYSANTLFVALVRALGIPARMCTGHSLNSQNIIDKKSQISGNTGHAWSEVWSGTAWIRTDATPTQQDQNIVEDSEKEEKEEKERMEEMGFNPNDPKDKALYDEYCDIQKEAAPDIRRLIARLEDMLPKTEEVYQERGYRSGELDPTELVVWKVTGKQTIFRRSLIEELRGVMNLFEAIILDRSGSMKTSMADGKTRMQHVTRTAVIRAEVLAHFGIPTLLIFFDDTPECVMEWIGSVSGKKTNGAPVRVMKGAVAGGGNNFTLALQMAYEKLEEFAKSPLGKGRKGNITFASDGDTQEDGLKELIDFIAQKYPISAYYLGEAYGAGSLQGYFGRDNTIIVEDSKDLPKKMADRFDRTLRRELQRILSLTQ